jgi:phosphoglycolate phosphatase-like HAD superfamily hydrolase
MSPGPVGFDLDLTLIDSRPQILASFRELSEETGVAIDVDVIAARLGLALYVGDTPDDMAAAVDGGAIGIGVTTGSFDGFQLREAGASSVLATLESFRSCCEFRPGRAAGWPPGQAE